MSNWLDRASALLEQSRFRDAEAALRRALIDEPENGAIHALLATSLVGQDKHKPAIDAARSAAVRAGKPEQGAGFCACYEFVVPAQGGGIEGGWQGLDELTERKVR